ncbi:MAG TPA: 3-hydroxyacyl-CoA dehydrogenase family protein [Spirochaetota bacterium]|nr:3-hydroxyacyl-CoA dehydrogenase family protein [Spirochaetota bacterium]
MREIKKVAVLGANGAMGSRCGGIFAQAGISCMFFARTKEKALLGIDNAVHQARSDILREYITPKTYNELESELPGCDWVFEALGEDKELKKHYFERIDGARKKGTIVSTVSSSLSVENLAEARSDDFRSHFMGVHFFNPPGKLPANELIFHPDNPDELRSFATRFCEENLYRINIVTYNTPGFAGNRIGFCFLNEAVCYAEKYGVDAVDYLLGPYTGRAMPPLATLDLVGLDVYRAIVDYIHGNTDDERHDAFIMPQYAKNMIEKGLLGRKGTTSGGFYIKGENGERRTLSPQTFSYGQRNAIEAGFVEDTKRCIHDGEYKKAVDIIKKERSTEGDIVRHFILGYISYSYSRIGEVTPAEHGIHGIDRVMAYGFSWLPPSGWVYLFGGPSCVVGMLEDAGLVVPVQLESQGADEHCTVPDVQKYLIAR